MENEENEENEEKEEEGVANLASLPKQTDTRRRLSAFRRLSEKEAWEVNHATSIHMQLGRGSSGSRSGASHGGGGDVGDGGGSARRSENRIRVR